MNLGSWKIDDTPTFAVTTHRFDTGAATDADSAPTYRIYEDETSTPIVTGTMALLDSSNTAGLYSEQITLSAANGFEKGKSYNIYITAAVNSVTGTTLRTLQVEAEVDANTVSALGAGVITAASIATGAIDADALAADAVDEILDEQIGDGTITMRQALRAILASQAGKLSGAATTTVTIRNTADSADVIVATVDSNGNRSAVTLTP